MARSGPDWDLVIADLAKHLASASSAEQVRRLLADAERDLARIGPPQDFWRLLEERCDKVLARRRGADDGDPDSPCATVLRLLKAKRKPEGGR